MHAYRYLSGEPTSVGPIAPSNSVGATEYKQISPVHHSMAPRGSAPDAEAGEETRDLKRSRKGFNVGPHNLPDGTHRRKGRSSHACELIGLIKKQCKRSSMT